MTYNNIFYFNYQVLWTFLLNRREHSQLDTLYIGQHPKNESLKLKGFPTDEVLDEIMVLL